MSNPYGFMMAVFSEKYKKERQRCMRRRERRTRGYSVATLQRKNMERVGVRVSLDMRRFSPRAQLTHMEMCLDPPSGPSAFLSSFGGLSLLAGASIGDPGERKKVGKERKKGRKEEGNKKNQKQNKAFPELLSVCFSLPLLSL